MRRPGIDGRGGERLRHGERERRRLRISALRRKSELTPEEREELSSIMRGLLHESETALGVTRWQPPAG